LKKKKFSEKNYLNSIKKILSNLVLLQNIYLNLKLLYKFNYKLIYIKFFIFLHLSLINNYKILIAITQLFRLF